MLQAPVPIDFSVDISCEFKVCANCELCEQKVSEIMHSVTAVYSVTFGEITKLEARANPNLILAVIHKYGEHGKVLKFHMEGGPVAPQPGEGGYYAQSAYYNANVNYQYSSPYAMQPQFLGGNYGYNPMPKPQPPQKVAAEGVYTQHTGPPPFAMQPPPPMPLSSYSYIEPPYWPAAPPSGGKCVIM